MCGPNVQFISTLAYILVIKERIYEYYIFELRKYELDGKKIIAVIDATFAVVKRKPEKKNLWLVRDPVQARDFFLMIFFPSNTCYFR